MKLALLGTGRMGFPMARRLCQAGNAVRFVVYKGRHDTRQVGFWEALEWMRALADGRKAPSDCRTLEGEP